MFEIIWYITSCLLLSVKENWQCKVIRYNLPSFAGLKPINLISCS